jgi:hypothetical protein
MRVSEGWKRAFIVLSAVYWLLALLVSFAEHVSYIGGTLFGGPDWEPGWQINLAALLILSAVIYGVLAGLVAGVVWIIAGFRKSKPADE